MQIPVALILCSAAVYAETINQSGIAINRTETVTFNGQKYKVVMAGKVDANGKYEYVSLENMSADGAINGETTFVIDDQYKLVVRGAGQGSFLVKGDTVNADGAVNGEVFGFDGKTQVLSARGAAAGILICNGKTLTCSKVDGAFSGIVDSPWVKFAGAVRARGDGSFDVNGKQIKFSGSADQNGDLRKVGEKWVWVPGTISGRPDSDPVPIYIPAKPVTTTVTTTTTAFKTPTSTPKENSGMKVGGSLAALAGIAAFFF
jgi:hypothetical protein